MGCTSQPNHCFWGGSCHICILYILGGNRARVVDGVGLGRLAVDAFVGVYQNIARSNLLRNSSVCVQIFRWENVAGGQAYVPMKTLKAL
jgi:hypothetical protein